MKKQIIVKQKHRVSNERNIMYQGVCEFERMDDGIKLSYHEQDSEADVQVVAYKEHMEITRQGETKSTLTFMPKQKSSGILSSAYGDLHVDIYTYKYSKKDNVITLEYDILCDEEVSGGYHIIWNIKEG